MATLAKGDIVLFPFPYTDLSDRKLRPCLVLSEEMGEGRYYAMPDYFTATAQRRVVC